jgi:membrane-bound serine protease (ClpP class)
VPVVVYVAPPGAWAGSAGCFITLAADVAAMAPATSIGAAHPVSLGGLGGEQKPDETAKQKLESFAASYIEGIASRHRRNLEWARASVRESASLTAEKALLTNAIDLIAADLPDLLRQADGREVRGRTLRTADAARVAIPMNLQERIFQRLWRPEVLFVLMLVVIYGIIGELSSPGAILPGVAGAIALVLALYMAAVLPVNAAGIALIALSVILFVIDVLAPTHGVLTLGGMAAFFLGALMLFRESEPLYRLSLAIVVPATLVTAAFFVFVVGAGLRAQWAPVRTGVEAMAGLTGRALSAVNARGGRVFAEGAAWNAISDVPVEAGATVEIVALDGLTLKVKPKA